MKFDKPNERYVTNRASSKDARRNALAMAVGTNRDVKDEVISKLGGSGFDPHPELGRVYPMIRLGNNWDDRGLPIAVFVEPACETVSDENPDVQMVWIAFNVKGKLLTAWRKKLLPLFLCGIDKES